MIRKILSVIVGYFAIVLFIFITFSATFLIIGSDNAFQPNSYQVSTLWIAISFVLAFIAAIVGGWICAAIAKDGFTPKILAGILFVLGLLIAIGGVFTPKPNEIRAGSVSNTEAMMKAQTPSWIEFANPFLGAIGVLVGAGLRKSKME